MLHIGTTNDGKIREIAALVAPLGIEVAPMSLDIPEPHNTLRDNAWEKARAYAAHCGGVALAEDSGLFIRALNDLPGPYSARYSRLDRTTMKERPLEDPAPSREDIDRLNNSLVLWEMATVPPEKRVAEFRICLMVAKAGDTTPLYTVETAYPGVIAPEARGTEGFGYDPIFIGNDTFGKTLAEIDRARKNLRSHRKAALDGFYAWASQHLELLS